MTKLPFRPTGVRWPVAALIGWSVLLVFFAVVLVWGKPDPPWLWWTATAGAALGIVTNALRIRSRRSRRPGRHLTGS